MKVGWVGSLSSCNMLEIALNEVCVWIIERCINCEGKKAYEPIGLDNYYQSFYQAIG